MRSRWRSFSICRWAAVSGRFQEPFQQIQHHLNQAVSKEELEVAGHLLHFGEQPLDEVIGAGEDSPRVPPLRSRAECKE